MVNEIRNYDENYMGVVGLLIAAMMGVLITGIIG